MIKIDFKDLPKGKTPILTFCRKLVKEGVKASTRLEIYRHPDHWDIAVTKIGRGAKMSVKEDPSPRFMPYTPFKRAA